MELDSKKIKLIAAGGIGLIAVVLIAVTVFGGGGSTDANDDALTELRSQDPGDYGSSRMAPEVADLPPGLVEEDDG